MVLAQISALWYKNENARVSIQNGSWMTGWPSVRVAYLKSQGFNVIEETDGQASDVTTVYLSPENLLLFNPSLTSFRCRIK